MRNSYQTGSVILVKRKRGEDEYRLRYRDGKAQRSEFIGTTKQYPSKASAEKAALKMLEIINGPRSEVITIADLIARFEREAMPERSATAHSYRSILKRVNERWGERRIDQFLNEIYQVGEWLKDLKAVGRHPKPGAPRQASPMFKAQVKNILHNLFEKAMLWNIISIQANPISVIKLKDGSKRVKELSILTPEDYRKLLADSEVPLVVKTLIQVCTILRLRISEALGLRWQDFDFENRVLSVQRSAVLGQTNETKTDKSKRTLPLDDEIIAALKFWGMSEKPVNGWVFGSERTGRPYTRDYLRDEYLTPAGERAGITGLGFHDLRHTGRAWMRKAGLNLEDQRDLMGHARIEITADVYGGREKADALRGSHDKVVEMVRKVG